MENTRILFSLNKLVEETFSLWDEIWVGFSWKNYFYNHTQRVRALCLEIGEHENADLRKLEYAAVLHDITKRYDGKIITDSQGKRIIDENGFWRNELLMPMRENLVTKLYRKYDQFTKLHNVSGAFVAKKILESYGFNAGFCNSVSSIIESHLKPDSLNKSSFDNVEKKILFEADTIDANIGLIAFYRNIQIHTHYMLAEKGKVDFQQYIERLDPWIQRNVSIVKKMMTKTGIQIAVQRRKRMKELASRLKKELENNFFKSLEYGVIGIIKLFIENNSDPNLNEEMNYLFNEWIPERKKMIKKERNKNLEKIFQGAIDLCNLLSAEIEGRL